MNMNDDDLPLIDDHEINRVHKRLLYLTSDMFFMPTDGYRVDALLGDTSAFSSKPVGYQLPDSIHVSTCDTIGTVAAQQVQHRADVTLDSPASLMQDVKDQIQKGSLCADLADVAVSDVTQNAVITVVDWPQIPIFRTGDRVADQLKNVIQGLSQDPDSQIVDRTLYSHEDNVWNRTPMTDLPSSVVNDTRDRVEVAVLQERFGERIHELIDASLAEQMRRINPTDVVRNQPRVEDIPPGNLPPTIAQVAIQDDTLATTGDGPGKFHSPRLVKLMNSMIERFIAEEIQTAVNALLQELAQTAGKDSSAKERLRSSWYRRIAGQYWAGYYAFYEAMERIGVEGLEVLHGAQQVASNANWWWAYRNFAVLVERPTAICLDQQNRLHCEDGPAVAYPDGWGVYAWHGTRVPAALINGEWTTDDILRESNAEVRRCAIEKIGWPEFVKQAKLKKVGRSQQDPGNPGFMLTLYDVPEQIFETAIRVLLCTNGTIERDGTRRKFGLTVPATVQTPIEAAAWGYNLTADEYKRLQVRR